MSDAKERSGAAATGEAKDHIYRTETQLCVDAMSRLRQQNWPASATQAYANTHQCSCQTQSVPVVLRAQTSNEWVRQCLQVKGHIVIHRH